MKQPFQGDAYRPTNWRRRLLLVALAIAAAASLLGTMLGRRGDILAQRQPAADVARCKPGQTTGCVGGWVGVIGVASGAAGRRER